MERAPRPLFKPMDGGSQIDKGNTIAFCGVDAVVKSVERGLKVSRECLRSCGAPDTAEAMGIST